MNLSNADMEKFLTEHLKFAKDDDEWLKSRGWRETDEIYKEVGFEAKVWISPTGKRAANCSSLICFRRMDKAIDIAHSDLIAEMGWIPVVVHKLTPDHIHRDAEGKVPYKSEEWQHFLHPVSHKLYNFLEAVEIARFRNNDETEEVVCEETKEFQQELGNRRLVKGEDVYMKFMREGEDHRWVLDQTIIWTDD